MVVAAAVRELEGLCATAGRSLARLLAGAHRSCCARSAGSEGCHSLAGWEGGGEWRRGVVCHAPFLASMGRARGLGSVAL